ncbi:MAG: aminotransferase class III-fold pyridoxal phosphate-dependent enzyme, partial [Nitrospira sp.]|nr:aminotransferase class III-fold pyridoxal phosphate-dependent enzyme [Nitrospira sp.]
CEGCFHGRTLTVTQMLDPAEESARTGFEPWAEGFRRIPFGDVEAVAAAAGPNTAAILVEPIQGEGGINIPPEGYLSDLRKLATEKNFLLILDEVQTGWGRTGEMFRFMHEGEVARPDVLCVGKSLSGGFAPISGILAGDELLSLLGPGSHGSTFGGSPLSSCIALAALAAIEAEDLPAQAKEKGEWLSEQLELIATGSPHVKEIRGAGMMFGIELNRGGPDGHDVCLKLLEIGLLAKDTHRWVIRFTPPVTASRNDLEFAIDALRKGLAR